MKELIEHDPLTGVSTYFVDRSAEGKFSIVHEQDVSGIIEQNKRMQADTDYKRHGIKHDFQHVAHIPDTVVLKWRQEGIDVFNKDHTAAIMRKLRDPEYRYLRTTLGDI